MNEQSGIHYIHQRQKGVNGEAAPVPLEAVRVRETVVAGLGDLLQGALDAVDDSLFELANNCRNNNEQNRYFEAMREIRIKRKGVERQFSEAISSFFVSPPSQTRPDNQPQAIDADNLALVGNDDLEEQVALNAMAGKAKAHFQGQLIQLEARFSQVYKTADGVIANPLAPEHLGMAFIHAIQPMEIQIRERLILLKQFDRYVMSNLGMLLDEANRILVKAGVIPHFRHQGKNTSKNQGSGGKAADNADSMGASQIDAASESAVFEQIRSMLAHQRSNAGIPQQRSDSRPVHRVSAAELGELLNALPAQKTFDSASYTGFGEDLSQGEPLTIDLLELMHQLLAQVKRKDGRKAAITEADEDLINLVSMLFDFILDDDNLSAPIQVLVSRLQIPILKVVMRDKTFFSHGGHPARRLLNNLARAGIGWSNSDEKSRDKLYNQIHTIVQRILEEFDGDVSLFVALNDEFDAFLERENKRSTLVEQRTRESERGRIKSQKAQQTVDTILKEKLARYKLPKTIHTIVVNGWSRVMFLTYLRDEMEHRWNESVKVLDDLIWCLHPHHEEAERDQWVRVVPGLLKTLRAGLEEVSFNSSKLNEMMAQLKYELAEAFRTNAAIETRTEPLVVAPDSEKANIGEELQDNSISEYMDQIDQIETGSWVEFSLVNGASFRCKLSAIIEEADCFVFVNRMGLKVIEKTRTELAQEMCRGRLTLLEQGALIDRALNAVVGSLRSKAG
ncbi:DUF1631 domain-containing protein [Marinobacter sp. M3C]|uniref:DUF1631 domain-containing protein n=1 Tax=Marinobacter sp. M3C TaxID=2917715 RepID=UPI00200C88B3|nr:DUF1631 domain-containing protein [Marinobacter sp. M3C]UQG61731.1 DUF1631 domain-containing protein [Marinobacter sp. M3C]